MPFLFPTPSLWATADWQALAIDSNTNVFDLPDDHPAKGLRCTVEAVEKYVLLPSVTPSVAEACGVDVRPGSRQARSGPGGGEDVETAQEDKAPLLRVVRYMVVDDAHMSLFGRGAAAAHTLKA
ncbi:hypothetical protein CDV55_105972 [Aspergillus turcosus]|nr:hypothetical protein CDV55_105972 [Aspergillus turcosus]